jgi:hypothetical protein
MKRKGARQHSMPPGVFPCAGSCRQFEQPFSETTTTMNKVIFSMLAAALVCVAGSAKAADGISSSTLGQMGLTGLTVMSDSDALAIRGLGFSTSINHSMGTGSCCGPRGSASPSSLAAGNSHATMNVDGNVDVCPTCSITGGSHSENAYRAEGPYSASGSNYSEAGATITKSEIVAGVGALTTSCTTLVWAGGHSSATSF